MPREIVLVVEDDPNIGGLVEQVLREAGYRPEWVRDVDEARAAAGRGLAPAAVLSDLIVAGSSGPDRLAGELERLFPGAGVALMTGVPPKRRAAMGVTHGIVIEKPFELHTLLGAVEALIKRPPT